MTAYSDPRPDSKIGKVRTALIHLLDQHRRDGALPTSVRFLFYELVMRRIVAKEGERPVIARTVEVRFDTNTDANLPWRFEPEQRSVKVHLGEEKLVFFRATNRSQRPIVGTATYNVTPEWTAGWFNKIQCFCFNEQLLQPGQSVDMPVLFFVDADMNKDRRYDDVRTITLSYTFYEAKTGRAKTLLGGTPSNGTGKGG